MTNRLRQATNLVHAGSARSQFGEVSEALFLTQSYIYQSAEEAEARFKEESDGFIYSRFSNPTVRMLEERAALLEGAEDARATATGMAAVSAALLCQLEAGDHVVAARALFGSCRYVVEKLLPRFGIETTLVDGCDLDSWSAAITSNTKAVFFETPTNPTLEIIDIAGVSNIAHRVGACVVVDNVFATPLFQSPFDLGADVVVYSATKHIDGQGRCLGGLILSSKEWIKEYLHVYLRQTGPSLSPFNAWILLKSLETLPVRLKQQTENAEAITDFLSQHSEISRLFFPHHPDHPQFDLAKQQMRSGSTLVTFELKGGKSQAFRVLNRLEIVKISNNLGDAKSLITHPATTTHQRLEPEERAELGITEGLVRLSVGLEDAEDLCEDLSRALTD